MIDVSKENRPLITYIVMYIYTNDDDFPEDCYILSEMFDDRSDLSVMSSKNSKDGFEFEIEYTSTDFSYIPMVRHCNIIANDIDYGDDIHVDFHLKEYKVDAQEEECDYSWSGIVPLCGKSLRARRACALEERGSIGFDD